MTRHTDRRFTEEEARRLWDRAARLQAEASARELAPASDPSTEEDASSESSFELEAVRGAAAAAGIDPAFVDEALLELEATGESRVDRWAEEYLGDPPVVARVRRALPFEPERVYEALKDVLPAPPYHFTLRTVEGDDPLAGAPMVFMVPTMSTGLASTMSGPAFDLRYWADLKEIRVRLRPLEPEGDSPRTELVLSASRAHARRVNFWGGQGTGAFVGLVAGVLAFAVTAEATSAAAAAEAVAGLAAGGATGLAGWFGTSRLWRSLYRLGQGKGEAALEGILDAVTVHVRTGGGFTPSSPPRGDGTDGGTDLMRVLGGL